MTPTLGLWYNTHPKARVGRKRKPSKTMFVTLTKDFMVDPKLDMDVDLEGKTDKFTLFGKEYQMYSDDWKHHVHLKCTNRCDADCAFCIERASRGDDEDAEAFLVSARDVVDQLKRQNMFRTLSVTGGEPTLFPMIQEVVDMAAKSGTTLFSMNSNGARMLNLRPGSFDGWLNLSKHDVVDTDVFRRTVLIGPPHIRMFKAMQPKARVRVQCVVGASPRMVTTDDILDFIGYFRRSADDFSFRSLIVENEWDNIPPLFTAFRKMLFDDHCCVEQTVQDYYVYETFERDGVRITLSWSNMYLLRRFNETHGDMNFLEEIIVHPDGKVTGSWNKKTLVIHEPERPVPEAGHKSKCKACKWLHNGCRYEASGRGTSPSVGCGSGPDYGGC